MRLTNEERVKRLSELGKEINKEYALYKEAQDNNDREKAEIHADKYDILMNEKRELLFD